MNTVAEWVKQAKSEIENLSPDQFKAEKIMSLQVEIKGNR
jgi:hypothetical protein